MSELEIEARWASGPDFQEAAEALGIRTNQIIGGTFQGHRGLVLYSPFMEEDPDLEDERQTTVYKAQLRRDSDDILVLDGEPVEIPGMWEDLKKRMEAEQD